MIRDEKQALKLSHGIKTEQKQQKAKAVAPTCVTMATTYTLRRVSIQTASLSEVKLCWASIFAVKYSHHAMFSSFSHEWEGRFYLLFDFETYTGIV